MYKFITLVVIDMFHIFVAAFLFATVNGSVLPKESKWTAGWNERERIAGGENALITNAPYQVAIIYLSIPNAFFFTCGGSIIRSDVIISAAQCSLPTSPSNWRIRAGTNLKDSGGEIFYVEKTIGHFFHNKYTHDNDISLYILTTNIVFDGITTKAIALPAQDAPVADDAEALITGWGVNIEGAPFYNYTLQKATVFIVNQELCTQAYNESTVVTPRMICAGLMETGGKGTCLGDAGGPLVIDGTLVGITSWGEGCGKLGFPGVSTRVSSFRNWIEENMP